MKHNTASAKTQLNKRNEWRVMGLPPLLVANELSENGMDVNLKHVAGIALECCSFPGIQSRRPRKRA
jgi:hypothetical protein